MFGLGSQIAGSVRSLCHPPTQEQIEARNRYAAEMTAYLNSVDGYDDGDEPTEEEFCDPGVA